MSRKAVLINAGGKEGDKGYLPGAAADVRSLRSFLLSNPGGAWTDDEVVVLHNPSRRELLAEITAAKRADYALVAASGHGHHLQGHGIDETRFCCNHDEEVAVTTLNTGSDRCTVIVDCCRHVTKYEPTTLMETRAKSIAKYAADRAAYLYRAAFQTAWERAEYGCSYLYSCNLNQAAQETQNGGYYTQALLDSAIAWHESQRHADAAVFDLWDVHNRASRIVTQREPQQTPESQLGRRRTHFPFAVVPDAGERRMIYK